MTTELFSTAPGCEIVSTRIVPAPREQVFTAWTDPAYLQQWWGPAGFTNTFHEFDLRPGGKWRFTMHGPEKGNYQNECEFVTITPPALIVWKRHSKPLFRVAASFEALAESSTRVLFRMIFDTEEECGKLRPFVVDKNEENFDRLERVLAAMGTGDAVATKS